MGGLTFSYDAFSRRIQNAAGTSFLYDGVTAVQEQVAGSVTASLLTGFGVDEIFTRTDASGVRNFLTDGIRSTAALTDSSGTIQTQYTYEPFGKTTFSGSLNGNAFQYTGREDDTSTGLYYYRSRYYSPTLHRFISEDPLGFAAGPNVYAYAQNSPVNLSDPTGRISIGGVLPGLGALPGLGTLPEIIGAAGAGAAIGGLGVGIGYELAQLIRNWVCSSGTGGSAGGGGRDRGDPPSGGGGRSPMQRIRDFASQHPASEYGNDAETLAEELQEEIDSIESNSDWRADRIDEKAEALFGDLYDGVWEGVKGEILAVDKYGNILKWNSWEMFEEGAKSAQWLNK
jgi:RHS repeat-associated protein